MRHPALAASLAISLASSLGSGAMARADDEPPVPVERERFSLHYQATVATQAHPAFSAAYSGRNSLQSAAESATSVVMDLFAGLRAWPGAELQLQPELAGGRGLSSTRGVAAFPSGEVYRVGDPTPTLVVGRAYLRQVIGLGGEAVTVSSGPGRLAGTRDRDALTITAGRLAVTDLFDANPVANDPHTRFMSWGLWASAAYDYPADTRGYTYGVASELSVGRWSARAGIFLEPRSANGMDMEWDVASARGLVGEVEARFQLLGRDGAARALAFVNTARMGSYRQAVEDPAAGLDVAATRAAGRTKVGVAASANQDLGRGLAVFLRLSWADGKNEAWAFTEVDRSLAVGAVQSGACWGRPADEAGLGVVVSGLSDEHRRYLGAGGYGFLLGDGALRYAAEVLIEVFYRAQITREVSLGVNYQPIVNPGYDADRGPVHVFTARAQVAF